VPLIWFSLGLSIGLLLAVWRHLRLKSKLRRLVKELNATQLSVELSSTSQLMLAIADYQTSYHHLEDQVKAWQLIMQQAPVGYLQVDQDNQLLWANTQACQCLRIQHYQQNAPRLLLELVRSYELDALIDQARDHQTLFQQDWLFYPALELATALEQSPLPLRGYAFPLMAGEVGVFLEDRQELVTLGQQRDRWASDVAHELRTPLTSIRLVAENLQARLEPPMRNWVDRLLNETVRLSVLVQELLDLSYFELQPKHQLTLNTVDLMQLIPSAWSSLEPLARTKALRLDLRGPDRVFLQADGPRLHRVLINLFDNSIKYSSDQQTIHIWVSLTPAADETAPSPQWVQIDLIDEGPGIPDNDLPHVFERFYRADLSRARHGPPRFNPPIAKTGPPAVRGLPSVAPLAAADPPQPVPEEPVALGADGSPMHPGSGSGLGLAIVRQIVEAHQGTVVARNHPQLGGAWLQIHLPASSEPLVGPL
jgi:two-component system, OmpR family, phosphate regulon sensor histidine kinase PhoR